MRERRTAMVELDQPRTLSFTFNSWLKLEKKYPGIMTGKAVPLTGEDLLWLVREMLRASDKTFNMTEEEVGDLIDQGNLYQVLEAVFYVLDMQPPDEMIKQMELRGIDVRMPVKNQIPQA